MRLLNVTCVFFLDGCIVIRYYHISVKCVEGGFGDFFTWVSVGFGEKSFEKWQNFVDITGLYRL